MKLITFIGFGFLALVLGLILPRKIEEYRLYHSNSFVQVTVKSLPDCSSGYKNKFVHVKFNNSSYVLRTKCKYVNGLSVGQKFALLHKPGTQIFLFKDEEVTSELVAVVGLALFLMVSLAFLLRRRCIHQPRQSYGDKPTTKVKDR